LKFKLTPIKDDVTSTLEKERPMKLEITPNNFEDPDLLVTAFLRDSNYESIED
jgi:hypothetical protein